MKKPVQIRTHMSALITVSTLLLSLTASLPMRQQHGSSAKTQLTDTSEPSADTKAQALQNYGNLPLSFEANEGQTDASVAFLSRGKGYKLYLTPAQAVLTLNNEQQRATVRMNLIGARRDARIEGQEFLEGKINYLIGNDQEKWHTNIPTYSEVRYQQVWDGIDMVWHGRQNELEYDFVVQQGADPSQIRLAFEGASNLEVDLAGNLKMQTPAGQVVQHAPVIYQHTAEGRSVVEGGYVLTAHNEILFQVSTYDRTKPLVIDPVLVYSTYLGGNSVDEPFGVAVDALGQAHIAGETNSSNFPTRNAIDDTVDVRLAFITKLNAAGTDIIYSTYLGSADGFCYGDVCGTEANGIALTSDGKACITGATVNDGSFSNFPVTDNAFQGNGYCSLTTCGVFPNRAVDAFVSVLDPDGGLFYSTFFGGSAWADIQASTERGFDAGRAIAVDANNLIYVAGDTTSQNLPTKNAFQPSNQSAFEERDAFIAVFNPREERGNDTLVYSSFLGGNGDDLARGIAVDSARNAYVVGSTTSTNVRAKSPDGQSLGPLQREFQGGGFDGFVTKVDTTNSGDNSLNYQTYFGGNINDRVESVAVDSAQRAYITGATNSSPGSFPLKNAFDSTQTNGEAFVAKMNADGTALFYCSFLGGDNSNTPDDGEEGLGIAIDSAGNAYVTGRTTSGSSFPVGPVAPPFLGNDQGTAFLAKIGATISTDAPPKLLSSTTFGGRTARGEAIAIDPKGNVYFVGSAGGDLRTITGAFQPKFNGGANDGFVAKILTSFNDTIGVFRPSANGFLLRNSNTSGAADLAFGFGLPGDLPVTGDWNGNGVDDAGIFRPSAGQFQLRLPAGRTFITITLTFGQNGDLPVAGDWNGDGIDTVGVFTPSTGQWLLTNGPNTNNTTPPVNFTFAFGVNGDTPLAGDWNGDGFDTPGLFRGGASQFILSNGFQGTIDITPFNFGSLGTKALAGDWDGDGVATVGVFNPATGVMALNNTNTAGNGTGDLVFNFGQSGDVPLAGDWDGKPELPTN